MSSINISNQNIYGKCDLKCAYNFKYQESNVTATNNDVMISLKYDSSSVPPVTYNNENYVVSRINIVSPSLHLFDGSKSAGEILIEHNPEKGGNNLIVCIPIIQSGDATTATNLITQVINGVSSRAPRNGETTNLAIQNFNLQNIVPLKPFFNYNYQTNDYIVFGTNYGIGLTGNTISTLQKIIKPFPLPLPGNNLFYNSKGPNTTGVEVGDGIYISCKPTDVTEEKMNIIMDTNTTNYDLSTIFKSEGFQVALMVLISCFLFIVVFYGINYAYSYFTSNDIKLPQMKIPSMKFT
jgi:hypothetical protein